MTKRFLSLLVCAALIFTLYIPVSACDAPEYEECEWMNEAISEEEWESARYTERMYRLEPNLSTLVFRNESGSFVVRTFGQPVKYYGDDGTVKDISLKIEKSGDGYTEHRHPMDICFGETLDGGYSISSADLSVSVQPEDVPDGVKGILSDNCKSVIYPVSECLSFEYSISYSGVKENIVLSEYTGVTEFSFRVFTNGLTAVKEGEDIILKTGTGETAGSFDDILVFYQGGSEAVCGSATLEESVPGQEYVVTVSVPEEYLNPETAAYPIVIDPSLNLQSNSLSIEDVTVYSNTTSSGTSGSLFAGLHSSYGKCRTLMRFPDFDAAVNSIHLDPDCVALAYVELRDIICDSNPLTVYCHEYTGNAWQESGNPSWASLGTSFVGQLLDQRTVSYGYGQQSGSGTNHRYRFNITDTVKYWIQNPGEASKGLVFKASDSFETGGTYLRKTFASHNRANVSAQHYGYI